MHGIAIKLMMGMFNYSITDIAEKSGISASYISEIIRDMKKPSVDIFEKIANAMNFQCSFLLRYVETISKYSRDELKNSMLPLDCFLKAQKSYAKDFNASIYFEEIDNETNISDSLAKKKK